MKDVKTLSQLGIGNEHPTYFIAEIGSNFDGSKQRAVDLIGIAKDAGAQAVKLTLPMFTRANTSLENSPSRA